MEDERVGVSGDEAAELEGWQPDEAPWDVEQFEAVNRLDTVVDEAAQGAVPVVDEPTPSRFDPYYPRHYPMVQRELNPAKRLHPEWPEEWYVHVPTSRVTWKRQAVPPGERLEVHGFPSEEAATADARAVWMRHWTERAAREPVGRRRIAPPQANRPVPVLPRAAFTTTLEELETLTPEQRALVQGPDRFLNIKGPKPGPAPATPETVYAVAMNLSDWVLVAPGQPAQMLASDGADHAESGSVAPLVIHAVGFRELAARLPLGFQWAEGLDDAVLPGHVRVCLGTPEALDAARIDARAVFSYYEGRNAPTGDPLVVLGETASQLAARRRRAFAPDVRAEHPDEGVARTRATWLDDGPRSPALGPSPRPVVALEVETGVWTLVQTGMPVRILTEDSTVPGAPGRPVTMRAASQSALAKQLPSGFELAAADAPVSLGAVRVLPDSPAVCAKFRLDGEAIGQIWRDPESVIGQDAPVVLGDAVSAVARRHQPVVPEEASGFADVVPRWLEEGRQVIRQAQAMGLDWPLNESMLAAVQTVLPPDGTQPVSPEAMRTALAAVIDRAQAVDSRLVWPVRQWAQHAERLTAQSAGVFVTGRQSDEAARIAAGDESPVALGEASVGTLSQLERAEVFATPMPNGQLLMWGAEGSWSASERASTPEVYQESLAQPVRPKWVQVRLVPTAEEARQRAAEAGKTLTITGGIAKKQPPKGSPTAAAVALWRQQVRAQYARNPEMGERVIAHALTRPRVVVDPAAEERLLAFVAEQAGKRSAVAAGTADTPPAVVPVKPPTTDPVYVGPWRTGEGVLWMKNARGQAQLAVEGADGRWIPAAPGPDVQPVVVQADAGRFAGVVSAAQRHVPHVTPLEVPAPLARAVAERIGPPSLERPHDVFWRAVPLSDRPAAVSWTYVYRMTPRKNGQPSLTLTGAPLARNQEEKPVLFVGQRRDEALQQALKELERQGLSVAPLSRPIMPREVADAVQDALAVGADRMGVRPPDPFATFGALPRPQQETVLSALPEPLRPFAVRGGYQMQPREIAERVGGLDQAVRGLQKAERALGDVFMNHPDLWKTAPAETASDTSAPELSPAVAQPGLGVRPA